MQIKIIRINDKFLDIPLPSYATQGSAGMDVYAAVEKSLAINPGETIMVPSGISIQLEQGYECPGSLKKRACCKVRYIRA